MKTEIDEISMAKHDYNAVKVQGIHPLAPRRGYYKITGLRTVYIKGQTATIATAKWKLHKGDHYVRLFTVDITLETLRRTYSPDHKSFFGGRMIDETLFIKSTIKEERDSTSKYVIEWELDRGYTTTNLIRLNSLLEASPEVLEGALDSDFISEFDDLDVEFY